MKKLTALSNSLKHLYLKKDVLLLPLLLLISGLVHGWNMFHYPYFENDEATYFAQAWSFLTQGKLAPYTYWYDHAPFGWILTSGWIWVTGGLFRFGFSLNSARVWMLVVHLISTLLLFRVAKKITKSSLTATITCVLFSLSPLAVYFQRRLLLDNLMTMGVLLSLFLILYAGKRLWLLLLSALVLGLAVLSKENAVFFAPVYFYLVLLAADRKQRTLAAWLWLAIFGMVISFYPLYAVLKQELFPTGTLLGGSAEHVSLLMTLKDQASRGSGLPFWNAGSDFLYNFNYWLKTDFWLMVMGSIAVVLSGLLAKFHKPSRLIFFLTASMLAFLMSGKLVINFYVIPLIPLYALAIGNLVALVINRLTWRWWVVRGSLGLLVLLLIGRYYQTNQRFQGMLTQDETTSQIAAINYVKKNIPPESHIAMDFYGYLDLTNPRFPGDPVFPNADWYWKVDLDPDIRVKKLANDPKNIQYILMTPQLFNDTYTSGLNKPLTQKALENSTQVAYFGPNYPPLDTLNQFVKNHPNGDWVGIYHQNSVADVLNLSWQSYLTHFIDENGRVTDPTDGSTQIRNVGYTLLRSVLANDPTTFEKVWHWTNTTLWQPATHAFATKYGEDGLGGLEILDTGTSSDGDQLVAYALALAAQKWPKNAQAYTQSAQLALASVWQHDVVLVQGKPYLVAGSWTAETGIEKYAINPASLLPAAYLTFAQLDPKHPWAQLATNSLKFLDICSADPLKTFVSPDNTSAYLPPNWCDIGLAGEVEPATEIDIDASDYSYEAFRSMWSLSEAALATPSATTAQFSQAYLQKITQFSSDWQQTGKVYSRYTHDGQTPGNQESLDQYAGMLSYFTAINADSTAQKIYADQIAPAFQEHLHNYYWGDSQNIFEQNWVWLNVWLMNAHQP